MIIQRIEKGEYNIISSRIIEYNKKSNDVAMWSIYCIIWKWNESILYVCVCVYVPHVIDRPAIPILSILLQNQNFPIVVPVRKSKLLDFDGTVPIPNKDMQTQIVIPPYHRMN